MRRTGVGERGGPAGIAVACLIASAAWLGVRLPAESPQAKPSTFAARIAALSEPPGYFDTDNLISNERSYLHPISDLERAGLRGGAYLGVGPDQNFSYIAQVRPSIALIVDIRRDNLLLHLLFKALFSMSATRVEYLAMLTGRAPPGSIEGWRTKPIADLVQYIDRAQPLTSSAVTALRARVDAEIRRFGVPLTRADFATIDRFHREFIDAGLDLRFRSAGRAPQFDYPDYRDLLVEVDRGGRQTGYLAAEERFQAVKSLQARDLVIPVVGNLSGSTALGAIARFLEAERQPVSAFYTSNVEFYLFRDGSFGNFVKNLGRLPRQPQSLIIRSAFGGNAITQPGYNSASITQKIDELVAGFAAGRFRRYQELVYR